MNEEPSEYRSLTVMESPLKTLQTSSFPLKALNICVNNNRTTFFNTFRRSKIEEGVSLSFKSTDPLNLSISYAQEKLSSAWNGLVNLKNIRQDAVTQRNSNDAFYLFVDSYVDDHLGRLTECISHWTKTVVCIS